ncbi:MAG: cysteine--tRNA ligase [bacterium]|nr:cysteine--tRNA ligase [bacterium]
MITLYDTLSQSKKEIKKPALFKKLRLFVCGPTVYDYVHIGNFRVYMVFDLLVRYLKSKGYKIEYLQNITDIDDKIINKAKEENKDWQEVARDFTKLYLDQQKTLNISSVDLHAKATEYIPQIISQVKRLIRKGYAYEIKGGGPASPHGDAGGPASPNGGSGGWYFDISKFSDYGKLAKRTVEQAEDGVSRIDENENKRNRGDFVIWKYSKNDEPAWNFKTGQYLGAGLPAEALAEAGRPGWHIEDTALSEEIFGPQYELHGAGRDLIFPHHEAEIALQESGSGKKPFVKHWIHIGMLTSGGVKMSKSRGNFITMANFLEKFSPDTFRLMVLLAHYRSPMEFSFDIAREAEKNRNSIILLSEKLRLVKNEKGENIDLGKVGQDFDSAMNDDFNTPKAMAVIFELINQANKKLWKLSEKNAKEINAFIQEIANLLGFINLIPDPPGQVKDLLHKRELSRINKQFDQSDALRKEIEALGYIVEDTAKGAVVAPKLK